MKANELRIGNLVYYRSSDSDQWTNDLPIEDGFEIDSADEYKPIPLTEEWLLKFGFEKGVSKLMDFVKSELDFTIEGNECICYGVYKDGDEFTFNVSHSGEIHENEGWRILLYIRYVHQLQNLYFALTAQELKISE
jgi:hypothetical protein